jgi:hypothetical protein
MLEALIFINEEREGREMHELMENLELSRLGGFLLLSISLHLRDRSLCNFCLSAIHRVLQTCF